jgi:hypothetical protein
VIETEPLTSEQVESVEGSGVGKQLLEEFRATNPANGVMTLKFTGTGCTVPSTIVSGQTVAEVVLDSSTEGRVELGQTPQERTSWLIRFPVAPVPRVWLIVNGTGKIQPITQVMLGGTALVLLTTGAGVTQNILWSPLP